MCDPSIYDLVDEVEDEDDGDDAMDVTMRHGSIHLVLSADLMIILKIILWFNWWLYWWLYWWLSGDHFIQGSDDYCNDFYSAITCSSWPMMPMMRRTRAQIANQNCCTNATQIVVTSDDFFIRDGQCWKREKRRSSVLKINLGVVDSVAHHHHAAVEVQQPGNFFFKNAHPLKNNHM